MKRTKSPQQKIADVVSYLRVWAIFGKRHFGLVELSSRSLLPYASKIENAVRSASWPRANLDDPSGTIRDEVKQTYEKITRPTTPIAGQGEVAARSDTAAQSANDVAPIAQLRALPNVLNPHAELSSFGGTDSRGAAMPGSA